MLKVINLILRYSIGKELVRGNRSIRTGRYTRVNKIKAKPRYIPVSEYGKVSYYITL